MPLSTQSSSFPRSECSVGTISSLPDYEGEVIPVLEVHELLIKIHDILDHAMSKQAGNSAHILVYF